MADSIVRLKVDSKEYDEKIGRARQGLMHFEKECNKAGKSMADATKEETQFVSALGHMQTISKTAKGQISELSNAFLDLSTMYQRMSDTEKNSEFGKTLKTSLDELKVRIVDTKNKLNDLQKEIGEANNTQVGGAMPGMDWQGMASGAMKFVGTLGLVTTSLALAKDALFSNIETARGFEKSMSGLQSLTGMTGESLDTLKRKAIELGSTTTQSASQVADAFAIIGSKRPDLLNSAYALANVTKAAITMSEAAGMEVPEASEALAAALNIFQLESGEANRVINILAAGSKAGSASIGELADMTFRAGGMAVKAGMSFEEFAGACELIRPAFGSAEEAGQAFNKFLGKLEEQTNNNFKPSVVGFSQAMQNLKDANLSTTDSMKEFTINGVKAYDAIMANIGGLDEMIGKVTGTNTAFEQASINTDNLDGSLKNLSSAWEGLNLAINSSNGLLKDCVDWLVEVVNWCKTAFTELGRIEAKRALLNGEGDGKKTRVDRYVDQYKAAYDDPQKNGSRQAVYDSIIRKMDADIKASQDKIKTYQARIDHPELYGITNPNAGAERKKIESENITLQARKQMREEFINRAKEVDYNMGKVNAPDPERTEATTPTTTTKTTTTKDKKETFDGLDIKRIKPVEPEDIGLVARLNDEIKQTEQAMAKASSADEWLESAQHISDVKTQLSDINALQSVMAESMKVGLDYDFSDLWTRVFSGEDIPEETWNSLCALISERLGDGVSFQLDANGNGSEKKTKPQNDTNWQQDVNKLLGGLNSVSSGLHNLGVELPKGAQEVLKGAQGVMQVIQGVQQVISVVQGSAVTANTIAENANTAALVANTAAMTANTTSNWLSFIPGFAEGGTIRGNSFSGDKLLARVNSGETILTMNDAEMLNQQLDAAEAMRNMPQIMPTITVSAPTVNASPTVDSVPSLADMPPVETRITGEDIVLIGSNYGRRTGRGELLFG